MKIFKKSNIKENVDLSIYEDKIKGVALVEKNANKYYILEFIDNSILVLDYFNTKTRIPISGIANTYLEDLNKRFLPYQIDDEIIDIVLENNLKYNKNLEKYISSITEKQRKLIPIKVYKSGNLWRCSSDIAGQDVVVKANTNEDFAKFLRTIKACDNQSSPRSNRKLTYKDIADEMEAMKDNIIWVWSNIWGKISKDKYIII